MKANPDPLQLELPPAVARKLGILAQAHGVPVPELVRRAVERQLPEWEANGIADARPKPSAPSKSP